jgi:uncharacterized membrane protein
MIGNGVYFISVIALPFLFIFLCKKYKLFDFLGVTISCFLGGMLLGNVYPQTWIAKEAVQEINNIIVPIGLILMLFSTDMRKWIKLSLKMLLGYVLSLVGVVGLALVLFFVFGTTKEMSYIAGMLTGTYVGGTPNMAAVKIAFGIPENLYNQIFLCDAVASSVYLLFVMVFAQRVLGLVLKKYIPLTNTTAKHVEDLPGSDSKNGVLKIVGGIALAIMVFAVPVSLWILVTGSMKDMSMVFIILSITLLAVMLSYIPAIRNNVWNYKTGDYLFAVFFTFLGTLTYFNDLANLPLSFLLFTFTILFGSVFIHIILCKIFNIDRDTMIITSAAGIMSPPFIPAIANAIKNKDLMAPGIAVGIVGLALGNVLGIFVVKFLFNYIQ